MEENRINRRARPRPYDLRRKVLLKNFLREQMTFIPGTQNESFSSNDDNNNDNEPAISLNLDEDLPELNDENASSTASTEQQCPSFSSNNEDSVPIVTEMADISEENSKVSQSVVEESRDSSRSSNLNKITSLMKLRSSSKKKQKGIVKAKDAINSVKSPTKSKPFKRGLERIFSRKKYYDSSSQSPKSRNSPRSLFSLFKNRRAQRNSDDAIRTNNSSYDNQKSFGYRTKHSPTNQSIETGDTWLRQALLQEQQSNRLLREENRILSESLSYFMSGSSMDSQNNHSNHSPLPNKHSYNTIYHDHDYYPPVSNSWNPRSRVARSKSVQEHSDRKTLLRNNYRTRSMNCHNLRNKVLLPDPKPPMPIYNSQYEGYNPRSRRKTILANLPINSSVRGIQRRSSMPERILSENDRSLVCRRSGSFRDAYNRKPFHSLPSEAFY